MSKIDCARGEQRLGEVRHLRGGEVDRGDEGLRDRLEGILDRVHDRVHGLLERIDEVTDRLDDHIVVRVVLHRPHFDRRPEIGEVQKHFTDSLHVLLAGLRQDEVLHQRPALSGRELADRVDDPPVLLSLPIAVDQRAPLLGGAEGDRLEELAVVVDVRQRLCQSGRDPQPLGPRGPVRRLVERPDLGRVGLRRTDAELQFLGAELGKRSDLLELSGC